MSYTALVARTEIPIGKNYTGMIFGKLKVIRLAKKYGRRAWECLCECNGVVVCLSTELTKGKIKKCKNCKRIAHNRSNLVGRRFGRLVVISYSHTEGKTLFYKCQCDCGNPATIRRSNLGQSSNSCGCVKKFYPAPPPRTLFQGEAAFRKLCRRYRKDAKKLNRIFTLTDEEMRIITSTTCHYCGVSPSTVQSSYGGNGDYIYNGIDRKDNLRGYELDNVVPCCFNCNWGKGKKSKQEFLSWIEKVYIYTWGRYELFSGSVSIDEYKKAS